MVVVVKRLAQTDGCTKGVVCGIQYGEVDAAEVAVEAEDIPDIGDGRKTTKNELGSGCTGADEMVGGRHPLLPTIIVIWEMNQDKLGG
jgi:hypothetical protein